MAHASLPVCRNADTLKRLQDTEKLQKEQTEAAYVNLDISNEEKEKGNQVSPVGLTILLHVVVVACRHTGSSAVCREGHNLAVFVCVGFRVLIYELEDGILGILYPAYMHTPVSATCDCKHGVQLI